MVLTERKNHAVEQDAVGEESSPATSVAQAGNEKAVPQAEAYDETYADTSALEIQPHLHLHSMVNPAQLLINTSEFDPNLPIIRDSDASTITTEKAIDEERRLLEENSPYVEVRAAVRNYDEGQNLPANTIRAWTIGLLLATVGSGINMLFSLRNPSIALTSYAIQLIAYPLGLGWDLIFPDHEFNVFGLKFNFKPGKFNLKEHTVIVVMANAGYGGGAIYATDVLVSQMVFYGQNFGWAFQILFAISNQALGYGLAGISRRWLVWPAAMIWPSNLVTTAMMYALHDHSKSDPSKTNGWVIGRYKYFLFVLLGSFTWYWFPGWIFQGLSYFVFATWIAPNNVVVNQLFGGVTGLGLIPITFDWTIITAFLGSPLIYPFHAIANTILGLFIFVIFTALGIHYSGALYSDYLPMQDSRSYDHFGNRYNVTRILDSNFEFNEEQYKAYSPIFLSTNFALAYGISFASIASVIVHTALYNGKTIWRQFKLARNQEDDVHMRLMKHYKDAPDWWYAVLFVIMLALSFVTILVWSTHFSWWAFIVCIAIPLVWTVPIGIIGATTNVVIGLNVLTEFIVGYMLPGRPLAMMMFKSYGYITMNQAVQFISDLKLGHYLKVPPRTLFWSQTIATIWSAIVQIAVMNWAIGNIPDLCQPDQKNAYTCPGGNVFFTASIIWGAIGPKRIFSPGAVYSKLLIYFLVGAVLPVFTYLAARKWPRSIARYVIVPVVFGGVGALPPATCYVFFCWAIVGVTFNKFIRGKYPGWWAQYNYITSAGLDTGLILCTILIFFTLIFTNQTAPQWFGNVAVFETLDMSDTAVRKQAPDGGFGPTTWA